MKEEENDGIPYGNDGIDNSSDSDELSTGSVSQKREKSQLNYGDIVIMIWRRVKMNVKIGDNLKL